MKYGITLLALGALLASRVQAAPIEADVCIYGGTSAGIAAAIQTARMGKTVTLIEPSKHMGGLTSGGLGFTDSGNKDAIGGISREFYQRVKKHYDDPKSWPLEKPETYKGYRPKEDAMWTFEPKVAEAIYRAWLKEYKINVYEGEALLRTEKGLVKNGAAIESIVMKSGKVFAAKMFIDATYEGDLMALAKVSYSVGREANAKYGETLNGIQRAANTHNHRFIVKVDPYVKPGDPKSGLLFGIDRDLGADGEGDHRLQAFCYRMCMSNHPDNRLPFPKPKNYDSAQYELLLRNFEAGDLRFPMKPDMMPNGKTDTNNNCAVSTDYIGQNHTYPDASDDERLKIHQAHRDYQMGLMWTLANHERVPQKIRDQMAKWGLPKDEFTDSDHWPHQIYVREARRLLGEYVMTEKDCRRTIDTPESVGMGSYNMDSHNCARYVTKEGFVQNEGDVQVSPGGAYRISYRSMVPKKTECTNLLVPVCLSSSHIAYGSIRMEPVFMVLGQSAATAICLALDAKQTVQEVKYEALKARLLQDKQVLELASVPKKGAIDQKTLKGIVVDDGQAVRKGFDQVSSAQAHFVGDGYRHDGGIERGKQEATYTPDLPEAGKYEVRLYYSPNPNRATNVPVTITHALGKAEVKVNQQKAPQGYGLYVVLGTFTFEKGKSAQVKITNDGVDGFVVIDALEWLKK